MHNDKMTVFSQWLSENELGQYVLCKEQAFMLHMVNDVFGYGAIQLGISAHNFLSDCRITRQGFVDDSDSATIRANLCHLPFPNRSLDLIVMPHTLDFVSDPHCVLSEAKRVLVPGGKLILTGFNPYSLWGIKHCFPRHKAIVPWSGHFLSLSRIKDWMKLLDLELEEGAFMTYIPPFNRKASLEKWAFMEKAGDRWWPTAASVYGIKAVKTIRGVNLLRPAWKSAGEKLASLLPTTEKNQFNDHNNAIDNK